jgi:hypothetical protein
MLVLDEKLDGGTIFVFSYTTCTNFDTKQNWGGKK